MKEDSGTYQGYFGNVAFQSLTFLVEIEPEEHYVTFEMNRQQINELMRGLFEFESTIREIESEED